MARAATATATATATASCAPRLLRAALLLLLLVAATRHAAGAPVVSELRCQCLQTVQGIHQKNIQSVKVTPAGSHCAQTEVIATLKNGQETCLNPEAPMVKKMIEKMLKNPQQEEEGGYTPGLVLSNWVTADKKHSEPPHPSLKI
uniref:C-X-C motif chemokine n=1 Tax=Equus caballus TaxID=9796 RepID=A0A9L0T2T8_HORSE